MSIFGDAGFPLGHVDLCLLAVHDLMQADTILREFFSGYDFPGTVTVSPGLTALVGSGTTWVSGSDKLTEGMRVLIGPQVVEIESVADDANAVLATAHADGAVGETMSRAGEIYRVDRAEEVHEMAPPVCAIAGGSLPAVDPRPGGTTSALSAECWIHYDSPRHPLRDDEASWHGLASHLGSVLTAAAAVQLCVDRFDNQPLVSRWAGQTEGLQSPGGDSIERIAIVETFWTGFDPLQKAATITQRW